jgi:hypothetical protein
LSNKPVVSDEAAMLATLLPVRIAPINRSRVSNRRLTSAARQFPVFSIRSMRAREKAVSAVSLPEKKKESPRQKRITKMESQSSMVIARQAVAPEKRGRRRHRRQAR